MPVFVNIYLNVRTYIMYNYVYVIDRRETLLLDFVIHKCKYIRISHINIDISVHIYILV